MEDKIFCTICGSEKRGKFCSQCQKETPNLYNVALSLEAKSKLSVSGGIKRGDISWAYFPIAYTIILTLTVGVISLLEMVHWILRIVIIIGVAGLFFYLCFFNDYFRKKIVDFFDKSKEHIEK